MQRGIVAVLPSFFDNGVYHSPADILDRGQTETNVFADWGERGGTADLFDDDVRRERDKRLYDTLDLATAKFGAGALSLGVDAVSSSTDDRRKPKLD